MHFTSGKHAAIASVLLSVFGTACTSSDTSQDPLSNDGTGGEFPRLQGFLQISEDPVAGQSEIDLVAGFTDYDQRIVPAQTLTEEQCRYAGDEPEIEITRSARAIPPQAIDAGSLILSSPSGTLATLSEQGADFYRQYEQSALMVPATQTLSLSLDITGGVFPSLSNISILDIDNLDLTEPALNVASGSTDILWIPSRFDDTHVQFFVQFDDGTELANYFCRVFDDGVFDLSQEFNRDFSTSTVTLKDIERVRFESHFINDAYFVVTRYMHPLQ